MFSTKKNRIKQNKKKCIIIDFGHSIFNTSHSHPCKKFINDNQFLQYFWGIQFEKNKKEINNLSKITGMELFYNEQILKLRHNQRLQITTDCFIAPELLLNQQIILAQNFQTKKNIASIFGEQMFPDISECLCVCAFFFYFVFFLNCKNVASKKTHQKKTNCSLVVQTKQTKHKQQ